MPPTNPRGGPRWTTARTEAFSDGVFAIAITLLVLELSVPEDEFDNLWAGIAEQWPSYLGYATSYLTIGGIWLSHHALFGRLQFVDRRIMRLNLLLLMAVSFLPFPTRLVAEAITSTDAERAAVVFYGAVLLVISLLVAVLWRAAAGDPGLLEADVDPMEIKEIARASSPSFVFYGGVMVVALVAPPAAAFGYLAIAVAAVMTARGEAPAALDRPMTERRRRRRLRRSAPEPAPAAGSPDEPGSSPAANRDLPDDPMS